MKIGTHTCIITPKKPCMQSGYVQRTHPFTSVHDDAKATVFVLDIQGKRMAWIGTDLTGANQSINDRILAACQAKGVTVDEMILGSSHNHSAPAVNLDEASKLFGMGDPEYVSDLVEIIAEGIATASQNMKEVTTRYTSVEIDGLYSNRNDANKLADKTVHLIGFYEGDTMAALYCTMAMHNTVLGPLNYAITGETFGYIRTKLEQHYHCPVLMAQGNAGDMGNRQYRTGQEFEDMERLGENITEQILRKQWEWIPFDMDAMKHRHVVYNCDFYLDAKSYEAKIEDFKERLTHTDDLTERKVLLSGIEGFKRKLAMGDGDKHIEMPAEIYTMNDLQIVCIPGELGSVLGLAIKRASKRKICLVWGYTGACHLGYIVDREAYQLMCQESNTTVYPEGEPEQYAAWIADHLEA